MKEKWSTNKAVGHFIFGEQVGPAW